MKFFFLGSLIFLSSVLMADAGALIVSNYPESISGPGTVFRHRIQEPSLRIMFYHKNVADRPLRFRVNIQNLTSESGTIRILTSLAGPNQDGLFVGHESTKRFLSLINQRKSTMLKVAGDDISEFVDHEILPGMVSTGIMQLEPVNGEFTVSVEVLDDSQELQPVQYDYGLYSESDLDFDIDISGKQPIQEIRIGDGPFMVSEHNQLPLRGHYSVLYHYQITLSNPHNYFQDVSFLFSPVGGIARGVFLIDDELVETGFDPRPLENEPEVIYTTILSPYEERDVSVTTLPQAGSFYPVNLVVSYSNRHPEGDSFYEY